MTISSLQVTAKDLEVWAGRRTAQDQLPRLLRDLILSGQPLPDSIAMVAGEGVQHGGWDGIVRSEGAPPFVPAGVSGWEISVRADIRRKAQEDYDKRVAEPLGLNPTKTTFIFATAREWPDAGEWCAERRADGVWRDVRVIDAHKLEAWLSKAPAVHLRVAHELGRRPPGVTDLGSVWVEVQASTNPPLSDGLVVAGRYEMAERVRSQITGSSDVITLAADTRDEALAFLAAAMEGLPEPERSAMFARAVVVRDPSHWAPLTIREEPLLLIPTFADRKQVAAALQHGHRLVLPLGREEGPVSAEALQIGRPRRDALREELEAMGVPRYRARELAGVGRGSPTALKRQLSSAPETERPEWSRPGNAGDLVAALLAGTWVDGNEIDEAALSELAARPYEEWSRAVRRWANEDDPPVRAVGDVWRLSSKRDALPLLQPAIRREDLEALRAVCLRLFAWIDPAHDLPREHQWAAGLYKDEPEASGALRNGLADTLAMLASTDGRLPGGDGQAWANRIVREALERADEDWKRWASMAPLLPLLAEAAPEPFLAAVERGLRGEEPILVKLFRDEESAMFASSPHVELLWALERLAWSGEHLSRSALALARLVRLDPGGTMGNRPLKSLQDILFPYKPQTNASAAERKQVLETVVRREPEAGWKLLLQLIPRGGTVSMDYTNRPDWRAWAPDDAEGRTWPEIFDDLDPVVDLMLEHAPSKPERWAAIASALDRLPRHTFDRAVDVIQALNPIDLPPSARTAVWDALRGLIARHQRSPRAKWVMPAELLDRLRRIHDRFEPADLIERRRVLFHEHPALLDVPGDGWEARRDALHERRLEAAREIHEERGLDGLIELGRACNRPIDLGTTIGRDQLLSEDEAYRLMTLGFGSGTDLAEVALGFAREAAGRLGAKWLREVLEAEETKDWSDLQKGEFLLSSWYAREVWDLAAEIGGEVPLIYWSRTQVYGLRDWDVAQEAAEKLIEHGRPYSAITLLAFALHDQPDPPSWDVAVNALEAAPATDPADDPTDSLQYHLEELLDRLTVADAVDDEKLARIEWIWLPLLEDTNRSVTVLHRELARNPGFFVEVAGFIYREPGEEEEQSEGAQLKAHQAQRLLASWRSIPGTSEDGRVDPAALKTWVMDVFARAEGELGEGGAQYEVGQVLARSPVGTDGHWPHEGVRDVIEELENEVLESSVETGRFNGRGVTMRGPLDGGDQETALAERYEADARALAPSYPRTAATLRSLARTYRNMARREDTSAELREDMER